MEPKKAYFKYSLKNIPIPTPAEHIRGVIVKTQEFLQRLRWKVHFFFNPPKNNQEEKNTFGFKTTRNAPPHQLLNGFEDDMAHLISNLEYSKERNNFQKQLIADRVKIQKSDKVFVQADKTRNIYELNKDTYKKLLFENVTSHYKKSTDDAETIINDKAQNLTEQLKIDDRVEPIAKKPAYITIKDHKKEFPNQIKCRLINPTKSDIGKISQQILSNINEKIRNNLNLQQWRSTNDTLNWFKNLKNKKKLNFIQIDIVDFYPSINKELFQKAISFAESVVPISEEEKQILENARQSLLFYNGTTWEKTTGLFDVTMGSYDGCELCELVGLFILHTVREKYPNIDFGLYRDDGLGAMDIIPDTELERIKKSLFVTFKNVFGLDITCETGLFVVDFLDVNLNLRSESYGPYRKPNDQPLYIHKDSNHPPHVTKQLPISVNKRLNNISCNQEVFDQAKDDYEKALRESNIHKKLTFEKEKAKKQKKTRKRNAIFYTPPFNAALKTDLGHQFLGLIDKHFPVNNPLHKIINRRTVRLSYSTTKNMKTIIQNHNRKVLKTPENGTEKPCNCRVKEECPTENKCCTENVVYQATVTNNNGQKAEYVGMTTTTFKNRFANHKKSFRHEEYQHETTLSSYVWNNQLNPSPDVKWKLLKKCQKYAPGNKSCQICTEEKFFILKGISKVNNINKKTDIGNKCIHVRNATFKFRRK